jgi:hypothetical protein
LSRAGRVFVVVDIVTVVTIINVVIFFKFLLVEKETLVLICKATLGGRKGLSWIIVIIASKNTYKQGIVDFVPLIQL